MAFDLDHGEDLRQILDAATAMLDANYPVARLRGEKQDDLAALAQFGAFAMVLPAESEGLGGTVVEEALLHVMLGRHLVSTNALAAAMAVRLAGQFGQSEIAGKAAAGSLRACAGVRSAGSVLLIDAQGADLAVVFGERRLALLDLENLLCEPVAGLAGSIPLARLHPSAGAMIGDSADPGLVAVADLLASAQLLGIAEATRDLAVSYAKVRRQFGKPIGAFQAVKHHCADMAVQAAMLSSLLDMACIAAADGRDDAAFQVAALASLAPQVALGNARACIQVHGGIGFSAEAEAHRHLKQAHALRQLTSGSRLLDLPAPLAPHTSFAEMN